MPLLPCPWLWRADSPARFCPGDTCTSLRWQHPSAPSSPSMSLSFQMPFARHAWNMHPQGSHWQTPCEALNGVGVGGPPTAAKLHKIPVIFLAPPSAANVSQKKASEAGRPLSVKVSVLKAYLQRIFISDKKGQAFSPNKIAKESDFRTLGFLYYCHCSLIQTLLLEHISFILHLMFPSVIPHICPNPPMFSATVVSAFH